MGGGVTPDAYCLTVTVDSASPHLPNSGWISENAILPLRSLRPDAISDTDTVIVALPLPLIGSTVAQSRSVFTTVHSQLAFTEMV